MIIEKDKLLKRVFGAKIYKRLLWLFFTIVKPRGGPQSTEQKRQMIINFAKKNPVVNFIETGTYIGETVKAMIPYFKKIYTIELNNKLYLYNKKKFQKNTNIKVIFGDSFKNLKKILPVIGQPSLFWLDAHFSGGITSRGSGNTPIVYEIKEILKNWRNGNIVLIDDARLFGKNIDYPDISEINKLIKKRGLKIKVRNDVIIIKKW